ncbi:hypothetical protein [Leptospira idonii]|uniref:Phospholipase n=1 Tax=Leptospira idonii TaxID=1193500 RepID=A0A4R9LXL9_9LEPT|nr:hypothetical protein [Leptospira idonii]TGN19020.1 hypothetical protein EHS15_11465 [Leptospira idonii]
MKKNITIAAFLLTFTLPMFAWSNHAGLTHIILKDHWKTSPPSKVKAESLASFLSKESKGIQAILDESDEWAAERLPHCPKPDPKLKFTPPTGTKKENLPFLFFTALRVNPQHKASLYIQSVEKSPVSKPSKELPNITTLNDKGKLVYEAFLPLREGESVSPLDILVTAVDEPDYDLDLYLFKDNESEFGQVYGFGEQPFGNPKIEYSSQAPFHMGFFHESKMIFALAGFLKRTYPEYRIHQFTKLSQYAFQTGHPYWGHRFAGWALHYLQDLTQPYHSSVLPRVGFGKQVGVQFLSMIGFDSAKVNMIEYITERHTLIEEYQYYLIKEIIGKKQNSHPVSVALTTAPSRSLDEWKDFDYVRNVITKEAYLAAEEADKEIENLEIQKYREIYPVEHPIHGILARLLSNTSYITRMYAKNFIKTQ